MGKKGWCLLVALALCVAVGAPLAVFGWMDAVVLGRDRSEEHMNSSHR